MSDLPYTLRQGAIALSEDTSLNWVQDALREAADALESYEVAERERLEHEAVTPDIDDSVCRVCGGKLWEDAEDGGRCVNCGATHPNMVAPLPLIPMREDFRSAKPFAHREYHAAMVAWVRAVTDRSKL